MGKCWIDVGDLVGAPFEQAVGTIGGGGNEMILPGLNGFFSNVPSMVIGRDELICHARVGDGLLVCCGCFLV